MQSLHCQWKEKKRFLFEFGPISVLHTQCKQEQLKSKLVFYVPFNSQGHIGTGQPGSYWDRSSALSLVGLEPTEVTAYD